MRLQEAIASAEGDASLVHLSRIHEQGGHTWLSLEPLLGPVTLPIAPPIDWLVVGPETGPGKRACPEWRVLTLLADAHDSRLPVWVKGMGGRWPHERPEGMVPR